MGAAQVIAVDWDNRFRMDLAMDLGADLVLGKSHDVVKSILEATEGRGVDNSCEFSGSPAALSNAIRSTRQGGWVNVLSVYKEASIPIPMNEGGVQISPCQGHQWSEDVVDMGPDACVARFRSHPMSNAS